MRAATLLSPTASRQASLSNTISRKYTDREEGTTKDAKDAKMLFFASGVVKSGKVERRADVGARTGSASRRGNVSFP